MKEFYFSDSHIMGNTGPFFLSEGLPVLSSFLDMVESEKGILKALGDVLDLYAVTIDTIMNGPNKVLVQRLQKMMVECAWGNHDYFPQVMQKTFPNTKFSNAIQIGPYTGIHGWQFDPHFNTAWKRWMVGEVDYLMNERPNSVFGEVLNLADNDNRTNKPLIEAVQHTGQKFVMGHTHVAADLGWFCNTGCWQGDEPPHYGVWDGTTFKILAWKG